MDLVFRNGMIVDGSGAKTFRGDVGVKDGKIVAVGAVSGRGEREIDLAGKIIAPGFIDVHTHYDAQGFWDPMLSPSVYHGVTTVLAGNCGFTLAPLSGKPDDADYLLRMLSRVEGMPLNTLRKALKPSWKSFGEFLDKVDGTLAINSTYLVGHCALRRTIMGERSIGNEATTQEIDAMCALLDRSLSEGGAGFSTTISYTHTDYEGRPVPSRWASREELLALVRVVGRHPGTWLEIAHGRVEFNDEDIELITELSLAAKRPLNWNPVAVHAAHPNQHTTALRLADSARKRGGMVFGLLAIVPSAMVLNFINGALFDTMAPWREFLQLSIDDRIAALRDPAYRKELTDILTTPENRIPHLHDWSTFSIVTVASERNKKWENRPLSEYAEAIGKTPVDALLDLAIEEKLQVSFITAGHGDDPATWKLRSEMWQHDLMMIGASDAGAHLDMINTFAFSTQLLGEVVRKRKLMTLEQAVYRITGFAAQRFGLKNRGSVAPGAAADLVTFDPETIDCGPITMRNDLPGDEIRLYAEASGIDHVVVNGTMVVENGGATGKLGGRVLRSGRDTATVQMPEPVTAAA